MTAATPAVPGPADDRRAGSGLGSYADAARRAAASAPPHALRTRAPNHRTGARRTSGSLMTVAVAAERRAHLQRRGLRLEYATLGWNAVKIGFLIAAAVVASSVALAGFAFDSFIEIFASIVVVRQLRGVASIEGDGRALRRIGAAFFLLASYIVVQAVVTLALGIRPDPSPLGIVWLAATCVVMFGLAAGKARTGRELGNPVLSAEARVTLVDGALAAAILAGLVLNAAFGWWW